MPRDPLPQPIRMQSGQAQAARIHIDALPYIDPPVPEDMQSHVEQLIEEEMAHFAPPNYLEHLPAPPLHLSPLLTQVRGGGGVCPGPDVTRALCRWECCAITTAAAVTAHGPLHPPSLWQTRPPRPDQDQWMALLGGGGGLRGSRHVLHAGGGGGFGTRPRYLMVCLWRRLLASRHRSFGPSVGPNVFWLCQQSPRMTCPV